jgi:hypothetical protein
MAYYVRFTTALWKGINGPFKTVNAARRAMLRDYQYSLERLACVVEAQDTESAMDAEAILCVSDIKRRHR